MTFAETGESHGEISLKGLLAGEVPQITESSIDFETTVRRIVTGGWPGWVEAAESTARSRLLGYIEDISDHDFVQVAGTRRDPRRFTAYLRAIAALVAQPAAYAPISRRIDEATTTSVTPSTVPLLHELAERLFLVEDQPAWAPKLRSRTTVLQTPKRHLADPSLAAALLGAGADRLLLEPETLGRLFEAQVVHDLRVYAQAANARGVFHYRDSKGRDEIDAVV